jgi:hypothetical protein
MPWNAQNTIKNKKPAGGGITLTFDNMTGVTTNIVPGWTVYTISSTTLLTKTITASVSSTTSINILMAGGGGGASGSGWYSGGGGGGRLLERTKTINSATPIQTFTCTLPASSTGPQVGGTTRLTFSDPLVGDISCGGGGYGYVSGGANSNAPAGGGSGGGGGSTSGDGYAGGTGVFGYNGGRGGKISSWNGCGGGGGAGGNGGDAVAGPNTQGSPGPGLPATLAGITSVYPSTTKFCSGGFAYGAGSTYGGGAAGLSTSSTTGNPGVIIIAVPT